MVKEIRRRKREWRYWHIHDMVMGKLLYVYEAIGGVFP